MSDPNLARLARRHAEHERQSVLFGVIFAVLAVTLLVGAAIYTEIVPLPFVNRPFSTPHTPPPPPVPCPPEGVLAVELDTVNVAVYNTTTYGGLAKTTGADLEKAGFTLVDTANSEKRLSETAIVFGPEAIPQAYTLALYVPKATLSYDSKRTGTTLDLMLGADGPGVVGPEFDANVPLEPAPGCLPVEKIK
ncbi:MAG: LytR C-terminal domain-containing protein [Micrococcales bacterium]|nr:LytR C-terminal domain-containing protein [Micrococcales bacterium]MCL2667483.1 LytR C-terminal domain-containing protein [Micrococcales bacterium]